MGEREREMETGLGDGLLALMVLNRSSSNEMWMDRLDSIVEGSREEWAVCRSGGGRVGEGRGRARERLNVGGGGGGGSRSSEVEA